MEQIVKLLNLLVPILKSIFLYQLGKSSQKKEEQIKDLEEEKKSIKEENDIIKKQNKQIEKYSNYDTDDIYNEWLSSKEGDSK